MMSESNQSQNGDQLSTPTQFSIRSRDNVVERILRAHANESLSSSDEEDHQLRRLIQTLRNRKGRFGLIFAVCNVGFQRKKLTQRIIQGLPDQRPVEVQLTQNDPGLLDKLLSAPGAPEPLIVYGLELLLPSSDALRARREQTLQELQIRREQFRKLSRPLVLWMPEYVYTMIGQGAVDFWSWQGGAFFFTRLFAAEAGVIDSHKLTDAAISLRTLPPHSRDFVGRAEEIHHLTEALKSGKNVVIHGMAGIGKTELAIYLASRVRDHYPDAQLFVSLHGTTVNPLSTADGLRQLIHVFQPAANLPDDVTTLTAVYRSLLHNKHALIVVDDVPDSYSAHPFIPPAGSVMILTSRNAFTLPGATVFHMAGLSLAESVRLLLSIAPRIGDYAEQIAQICGGLPLALRLAASALSHSHSLSPADLVLRLQDRQKRLQLIEASLSSSYDLLGGSLQLHWSQLSVFPDYFDASGAAAVWDLDIEPAKDVLAELESYSLMEWDESIERYHLHPLARDFALTRLTDDEHEAALRRHAVHYRQVLSQANELYLSGGDGVIQGLHLFDRERSNIQAGHTWAVDNAERDDEAAQLCIDYPKAGHHFLDLRLHPHERIRWQDLALATAQKLKDRQAEGNALSNLGNAWLQLGEARKSIEYYEQALAIAREVGDRRGEGNTLGNLSSTWYQLGEVRKSIEFQEQALAIAREIGNRHVEGRALGNLGIAWRQLGEVRKSIEFQEQALAIAREIGNRRDEGLALGNLGNAWHQLGEARKSTEYFEQALAIAREIDDRDGEGIALGNLGKAWLQLGDQAKAVELMEASLRIFEEIESPHARIVRQWLDQIRSG